MIKVTRSYSQSYVFQLFSRIEAVTLSADVRRWIIEFENGERLTVRATMMHSPNEFLKVYIAAFYQPPEMDFLKKDWLYFVQLVGEKLKEGLGVEGAGVYREPGYTEGRELVHV